MEKLQLILKPGLFVRKHKMSLLHMYIRSHCPLLCEKISGIPTCVPRSIGILGSAPYQRWTRNRDGRRPSLTKVLHRKRDVLLQEAQVVSLSSFHGSRLPASAPGIWRPRLPTRDKDTTMQKRTGRLLVIFARSFSAQFAHVNPSSSSLFILR